jgi:hypothetical protein
MQIFMLTAESSETPILLTATAGLFHFSVSWTADKLMHFSFHFRNTFSFSELFV